MTEYHHRSGPLKQKNKNHKTGRHFSKNQLKKVQGGKVDRKHNKQTLASKSQSQGKADRVLRTKQIRDQKKLDLLRTRRAGKKGGPAKIVGLVGLGAHADTRALFHALLQHQPNAIITPQNHSKIDHATRIHVNFPTQKQQFIFCLTSDNHAFLSVLDIAKVADVLVYVLPMHTGISECMSSTGDAIIRAMRSQGPPAMIGVIQGLDNVTPKARVDKTKYAQRLLKTEFGTEMKIVESSAVVQLLRTLCTITPRSIHWRDIRSYLLVDSLTCCVESDVVQISGFLRGQDLSPDNLLHVTDVGTFQMSSIKSNVTEQVWMPNAETQQDLQYAATVDPMEGEQTWPTQEELDEAEANKVSEHDEHEDDATSVGGKDGMSSYQSSWVVEPEEEDDEEDEEEELDQTFCIIPSKSERREKEANDNHDSDDDDDDDMSMMQDDELEQEDSTERQKLAADDQDFPDEIDLPTNMSARTRLARYRGLESFRNSPWDPKESLPLDYAKLYQFQDFMAIQKRVLKHQSNSKDVSGNGMDTDAKVASGTHVTICLSRVSPTKLWLMQQKLSPESKTVLICGSVLQHENRMSVLNFNLQRLMTLPHEEEASEPESNEHICRTTIRSKDELVFHCGFRRFTGRPIFSDQNLNSDKHRFQRFLPSAGWSVASVYGPAMFQPTNVLMFHQNKFVASGTLMNVNPDRIVLKRILLTGVPVKVKRRKAVIRYMFRSPEDIKWFKPVGLWTKHGATGHIKTSLGTHGDFKAIMDKPIQNHDTVCMALYKRVFPKLPRSDEEEHHLRETTTVDHEDTMTL